MKEFKVEEVKDQRIRKVEINKITDLGKEGWENFNHFLKHITCYEIAGLSGQGTVPFELIKEGFTHFARELESQMHIEKLTLTKSHLKFILEACAKTRSITFSKCVFVDFDERIELSSDKEYNINSICFVEENFSLSNIRRLIESLAKTKIKDTLKYFSIGFNLSIKDDKSRKELPESLSQKQEITREDLVACVQEVLEQNGFSAEVITRHTCIAM